MELPQLTILKKILVTIKSLYSIESALLRAEMRETTASVSWIAIMGMVAFVLWLAAILMICLALVALLMRSGLEPHLALGIIGTAVAAIAVIFTATAIHKLNSFSILPRKTMEQVKKDLKILGINVNEKAT